MLNSNLGLKDQVRELKQLEKELQKSKREYKGKYTDLKEKMKEKETESTKMETKYKHLEEDLKIVKDDLEKERQITADLNDTTAMEQEEVKHKAEIKKIRKMYEGDIEEKNKKIDELRHDRELKIQDRDKFYRSLTEER